MKVPLCYWRKRKLGKFEEGCTDLFVRTPYLFLLQIGVWAKAFGVKHQTVNAENAMFDNLAKFSNIYPWKCTFSLTFDEKFAFVGVIFCILYCSSTRISFSKIEGILMHWLSDLSVELMYDLVHMFQSVILQQSELQWYSIIYRMFSTALTWDSKPTFISPTMN